MRKIIFIALFVLMSLQCVAFNDVGGDHLYFHEIKQLSSDNVVQGYDDGSFRPGDKINRAEFLKIVLEAKGVDVSNCEAEFYFSDVKSEDWFYPYVCSGVSLGVINGYADGSFKPGNYVNYAEAAKMALESFGYYTVKGSVWYIPYIEALNERIVVPKTIHQFDQELSRGEMSALIARLINHPEYVVLRPFQKALMIQEALEYIDNGDMDVSSVDVLGDAILYDIVSFGEAEQYHKVTFLYNKTSLQKSPYYLNRDFELGYHAIYLTDAENEALFTDDILLEVDDEFELDQLGPYLCTAAGLREACLDDADVFLYRYNIYSFVIAPDEQVIDLLRMNTYFGIEDIDQEMFYDRLVLTQNWFLENVDNKSGTTEYTYYPLLDEYAGDNSDTRKLAVIWSQSNLLDLLDDADVYEGFDELIVNSLDYYMRFLECDQSGKICHFDIDGDSKIANNAFVMMELIDTEEYQGRDKFLSAMGEALLEMQKSDGSFYTDFESEVLSGVDFYPGEAMLAMMEYYFYSEDERYLGAVDKAFYYYRDYWRENKNTAFMPWHTQTYYYLYKATERSEVADFIFEMCDWIIAKDQIWNHKYEDLEGAFSKMYPRVATGSYLEGLTDAYEIAQMVGDADRMAHYADSIRKASRFLINLQFTSQNSFYLPNPDRAIGGFKYNLINTEQRNDYTQHALNSLMKAYKLELF